MDSTVSVSKGVFVFPNGFKKGKVPKKRHRNIFETIYKREPWYSSYQQNWKSVENKIMELHSKTYDVLLDDMVKYIKSYSECNHTLSMDGVIPSATLLTGVNQPDHVSQFMALTNKIREDVTPHIAMITSQDSPTVKHIVENTVWQLILGSETIEDLDEDSDDEIKSPKKKLKKNECTMKMLQKWYQHKYSDSLNKKHQNRSKRLLVVVIPDFEGHNCNVLQDFVLIVSSYTSSLPILLVFGVATSVSALHKSFPHHVSSKLMIQVFHSHASPVYMNQVLEEVFLTHTSPFQLSGRAFELLTDVFLFYDFSVTQLLQSIKYCTMEHYYGDNTKSVCCDRELLDQSVSKLSSEDLESIRQMLSFRPFLEKQDCYTKVKLFEDDEFFRSVLLHELDKFHGYLCNLYAGVRLLVSFVKDLPKNSIGNSVREVYTKCASDNITKTPDFKESMQLLKFQSQHALTDSIKKAIKVVNCYLNTATPTKILSPSKHNMDKIKISEDLNEDFVSTLRTHLMLFLRQIEKANTNTEATVLMNSPKKVDNVENMLDSRYKLKEKLLKATKVDRIQSEFEMVRGRFVSYLEDIFSKMLQPAHLRPFHEIFLFSDVAAVKKQIIGTPRAAIHTALTNPVHYLQCSCCHLPSSGSVLETLPDICLAYILHRECGKHINLYDWLQAFAAVLRVDLEDDDREQLASIQSRFTRAVAELQFLGFIKSSKRKTDHVMRLTW